MPGKEFCNIFHQRFPEAFIQQQLYRLRLLGGDGQNTLC